MILKEEIKKFFVGDVSDDNETIIKYSRDASLFEVRPKVVVFPKNVDDIKKLVKWVTRTKKDDKSLSLTARSAGTDMSGGPLNESIIIDFTKYLHGVIGFYKNSARVLPGTFYRDFEKETLEQNLILPSFPASKGICAIGGIVSNNSGGEKTLKYGKTEDYINELKVIFSDGNEYVVKPLNKKELEAKIAQGDFEGNLYKQIYQLINRKHQIIKHSKPTVHKNSAGYYIWNVLGHEGSEKYFDLTKLIVGSQGTLGIVTEVNFHLVQVKKYTELAVFFLKDQNMMPRLVTELLRYHPESIEDYDDKTLRLAIKFLPQFMKGKGVWGGIKFLFSFLPDLFMMMRSGFPKAVFLAEFADDNLHRLRSAMRAGRRRFRRLHIPFRFIKKISGAEKYWNIRRESFNLLRHFVRGKKTVPFIDDVIVKPQFLSEFLPKLNAILADYPDLEYTIAGHAGDGNFHIIPLVDIQNPKIPDIVMEVSNKVYDLVVEYNGSITAEHNDGIIRTPFLYKMYNTEIIKVFKEIKEIFDPQNIFNPGKKVPLRGDGQIGSKQYIKDHIAMEQAVFLDG